MAEPASGAKSAPTARRFGLRDLWRMMLWGSSAAIALFVAIYAGSTEIGRDRLRVALAEVHEILLPTGIKPVRPLDAREGQRLAETVRSLSADRDRLLARIATLEQNVEGITGSIARVEKAARPPEPQPEPGGLPVQPPPHAPAPEDVTSSINPPANVPLPPQPPSSGRTEPGGRPEFGLDLGGAGTLDALRTAWTAALRRHGQLLEGLHPIVQTRERARPAAPELRLIAGPVPNAATAARLCAAMTAAGAICAPAVFDGQRLAGR